MPININTGIPEPENIDITDFINQTIIGMKNYDYNVIYSTI